MTLVWGVPQVNAGAIATADGRGEKPSPSTSAT